MKKLIFPLTFVVLMFIGCMNEKHAGFTNLGDYTPYDAIPEKLIGKVERVIEKNYWAIPDGETFKKGNLITIKDRDSVSWTNDFNVVFDKAGDVVSCDYLDENNKSIYKWELVKENNILVSAKVILKDTVRLYQKFKYNEKGENIGIFSYRSGPDTLISSGDFKISQKKDTITRQYYNYKGAMGLKQIYIFNDKGQFLRRESFNKDGAFSGSIEEKYNDKGKMSELTFYDKDRKAQGVNHFTYEYDQKGNWTKAVVKDGRGFVVIEERTYTYFE